MAEEMKLIPVPTRILTEKDDICLEECQKFGQKDNNKRINSYSSN